MSLQQILDNTVEQVSWYIKNSPKCDDTKQIDFFIEMLQQMKEQESPVMGTPTQGTSPFKELIQQRCERVFENVDVLTGQDMFAMYKAESELGSSAMVRDEILQAEQDGFIKRVPPHGLYCLANWEPDILLDDINAETPPEKVRLLENIFKQDIEWVDNYDSIELHIIKLLTLKGKKAYDEIYKSFPQRISMQRLEKILHSLQEKGVIKASWHQTSSDKLSRCYQIHPELNVVVRVQPEDCNKNVDDLEMITKSVIEKMIKKVEQNQML